MSFLAENRSSSRDSNTVLTSGHFQVNGCKTIMVKNASYKYKALAVTSNDFSCVVEQARNLVKQQNIPLSIGHYLNNMNKLTSQWNQHNYKDLDRQRIYLKDIDCPEVWHQKLKEQVPPCVFYLNESTGEVGGPGSIYEPYSTGTGMRKGLGVARAGDLMSCLPAAVRADNLMCYIGHEGTYTPAHREMCASLGQNIMVETSGVVDENGKPTKPGSSIWFMTETKDRHLVSEYWLSTLGHDIEIEAHFAQINAWKGAPFKTYVVEQKDGDFILIPPLAPHQVWNRGTRTMKVAWNRTTVETLEMALNEALPRARMVCRDEQYKNKAIILFASEKYSNLLKQVDAQRQGDVGGHNEANLTYGPKIRQLQKDFKRLFALYTQILLTEMLAPVSPGEKKGQYIPYDGFVTCSYCRCNIFNRFLTCTSCITLLESGEEDTYDICMECYAMGRSCKCISRHKWVEQFPWQELIQKHDVWRHQIIAFEGKVSEKSPKSLASLRKMMTKKTLAQVCQEQLKIRPWVDPSKETSVAQQESEKELDDVRVKADGSIIKKRRRPPSEKVVRETVTDHVGQAREPRWKMAICNCGRGYTYGTLFRAFDLMPLSVMEDPDWKCPYCLQICSCAQCRKLPSMHPFEPKGTILGYDTKKVADARSVESLVDFSHSNIGWIKKAGDDHPHENKRLRRCQDEAAQDKSTDPEFDDHYVDVEEYTTVATQNTEDGIRYNMDVDCPIDPLLRMEETSTPTYGKAEVPSAASSQLPGESSRATKRPKLAADAVPFQHEYVPPESLANLSNMDDNEKRQPIAPPAVMTNVGSHDGGIVGNDQSGSTSHYPDPNLPSLALLPHKEQQNPPTSAPLEPESRDNQRSRKSFARTAVQNDVVSTPRNDANAEYKRARIERTLAEAKRNNRFVSAEAAMSGKSLQFKVSVNKARLAAIIGLNITPPDEASSPKSDGPGEENTDFMIVKSDLPAAPLILGQVERPRKLLRKKKVDIEDDDFSTRQKSGRKAVTERASLPNLGRKSSANYEEISSGNDSHVSGHGEPKPIQKQRKPRALPSYLARRSDPAVIEASLDPYEAITRHRQRRKTPRAHEDVQEVPLQVSEDTRAEKHQPRGPVKPTLNPSNGVRNTTPIKRIANLETTARGSEKTKPAKDPATQRAEDNRRAKLRALLWAQGNDDEFV